MGGRGSSSSLHGKRAGGKQSISAIEKKIDSLGNSMYEIARENAAGTGMPQKYYDIQKERRKLQDQLKQLRDQEAKKKQARNAQVSTNTFVNSFGEATKRNITTNSYERRRKRLSKEIMSLVGGK